MAVSAWIVKAGIALGPGDFAEISSPSEPCPRRCPRGSAPGRIVCGGQENPGLLCGSAHELHPASLSGTSRCGPPRFCGAVWDHRRRVQKWRSFQYTGQFNIARMFGNSTAWDYDGGPSALPANGQVCHCHIPCPQPHVYPVNQMVSEDSAHSICHCGSLETAEAAEGFPIK